MQCVILGWSWNGEKYCSNAVLAPAHSLQACYTPSPPNSAFMGSLPAIVENHSNLENWKMLLIRHPFLQNWLLNIYQATGGYKKHYWDN